MACFIVPAAEAIVTTAATKIAENKEQQKTLKISPETGTTGIHSEQTEEKTPFSRKLKWLDTMLWGGAALLLLEHIWHGEVTPIFPFFTAASTPEGLAEMLTEMRTVGVAMALAVTLVWAGLVVLTSVLEKRPAFAQKLAKPAKWSLGTLGLILGGALVMGLTDAAFSLQEMGTYAFFHPTAQVMMSNLALALCALVLGVALWAVISLSKNRQTVQK